MNPPVVLLLIGGLLLLIALVGGGLEVKELRIPKIERLARLFCGVAGVVFVLLGINFNAPVPQQDTQQDTPNVQFVVFETLAPEGLQLVQTEKTKILIDGNLVGHLVVNPDFPALELPVTVAKAGLHSFSAESTVKQTDKGQTVQLSCVGVGMIDVQHGARFSLEGRIDPDGSCRMWLEKTA